jgi:TPR repeat protein
MKWTRIACRRKQKPGWEWQRNNSQGNPMSENNLLQPTPAKLNKAASSSWLGKFAVPTAVVTLPCAFALYSARSRGTHSSYLLKTGEQTVKVTPIVITMAAIMALLLGCSGSMRLAQTHHGDPVQTLKSCFNEAEQGHAEAQECLGWMYSIGAGVAKDDKEAVKWFQKSANQGNDEAQYRLSRMYKYGDGVEKNDAEASKWLHESAEQGNVSAQLALAKISIGEYNEEEALKWYAKPAERGDAWEQFWLGRKYALGKYPFLKNDEEAVKWFQKAAEQGHAGAQYELARMYAEGLGVKKDKGKALAWHTRAAEQGHASAQYWLGVRYAFGFGVPKNAKNAAKWLQSAMDHGNSNAAILLNELEQKIEFPLLNESFPLLDESIEESCLEAVKEEPWCLSLLSAKKDKENEVEAWVRQLEKQGDAKAQFYLGEINAAKGWDGEAGSWYQKSAEQLCRRAWDALRDLAEQKYSGFSDYRNALGNIYAEGRIVVINTNEAVKWYQRAAKDGCGRGYDCPWDTLLSMATKGNVDAQFGIAELYAEGIVGYAVETFGSKHRDKATLAKDYSEAARWYSKAAEQGHKQAQIALENLMKQKW